MYKLSPSDFAYLYEECKLCYYLKVKYNIYQPSKPMPGIFGAINSRLQGALIGQDLRTLSPTLPEGRVESQEEFVESQSVPDTRVYLKGKYDLLVKRPDGTYLIVDFKLSEPKEEKITMYRTQLQAYKFALEHPASGKPKPVTQMGLVVMYPDKAKFERGQAMLNFPPKWLSIPEDMPAFLKFMREINDLLTGPTPKESPACLWCKYRHVGEQLAHG